MNNLLTEPFVVLYNKTYRLLLKLICHIKNFESEQSRKMESKKLFDAQLAGNCLVTPEGHYFRQGKNTRPKFYLSIKFIVV